MDDANHGMPKNERRQDANTYFLFLLVFILLFVIAASVLFQIFIWPLEKRTEPIYTELGTAVSTDPATYFDGAAFSLSYVRIDTTDVKRNKVGLYNVYAQHGMERYSFPVIVKDTEAPIITLPKHRVILARDKEYAVDDLVETVFDRSGKTKLYASINGRASSRVLLTHNGSETIQIIAYDSSGNQSMKTLDVFVEAAPVMKGVKDCYVTKGRRVDILSEVTAYDEETGDLTDRIKLDAQEVNWAHEGVYTATLSVEDEDGLTTTKEIHVSVLPKFILNDMLATRVIDMKRDRIAGADNLHTAGVGYEEDVHIQRAKLLPCAVHIEDFEPGGYGWFGSGFIIDIKGDDVYICSNQHVLAHSTEYSKIFFYDGTWAPYEVLGLNESQDVGIAKVNIRFLPKETADGIRAVQFDQRRWRILNKGGESVFMSVIDLNGKSSMRIGKTVGLSHLYGLVPDYTLRTTIELEEGNSGSAIMDKYGGFTSMATGYYYYGSFKSFHSITADIIVENYEAITGNKLYILGRITN
jgi:hypothetical protein